MYNDYDWIRKDTLTASVYYGYSPNFNAADSDDTWVIKQIVTSGTVQTVKWTNGSPNYQISSWTDRVASFSAPTHSITGITWSTSLAYNANTAINLSWTPLTGVDRYQILIKDQTGAIFSEAGYQIYSLQNEDNVALTKEVRNSGSYNWLCGKIGTTYSITITALNVGGQTSSTVTVAI
jgi:hypothetical protein